MRETLTNYIIQFLLYLSLDFREGSQEQEAPQHSVSGGVITSYNHNRNASKPLKIKVGWVMDSIIIILISDI